MEDQLDHRSIDNVVGSAVAQCDRPTTAILAHNLHSIQAVQFDLASGCQAIQSDWWANVDPVSCATAPRETARGDVPS